MHQFPQDRQRGGDEDLLAGAVKSAPIRLAPGMTLEQAFRTIVKNCLAQVQANEDGVAKAHDVESVHQMRVGLRRLRSALGIFRKIIACPDELQAELDWLGTELGRARDWDVLAGSTLADVATDIADSAIVQPVSEAARAQAAASHVAAAAAIRSPRYASLVRALSGWVQDASWRVAGSDARRGTLAKPIRRFARKTLMSDHEALVRRGRRLKGADAQTRHRLRIAAKKTRYATEFFESLFPAKRVRPYVAALARLQEQLGYLNDAAVASTLLQELEAAQPELGAKTAFVRGYLACLARADDRRLRQAWKRIRSMPLPLPLPDSLPFQRKK
ncbi:CHAD domain-containing protein [Lacisediminimonas profundi]|uniref:CHAD domain-containing protein n=1 Tax=Lacisediminimonas profundi TaxID=2603856 RepID=UPI001386DAB7|nr:CHAD domain-containing protein [Lacisediminimonas profundi]